jgi:hypothetical protein
VICVKFFPGLHSDVERLPNEPWRFIQREPDKSPDRDGLANVILVRSVRAFGKNGELTFLIDLNQSSEPMLSPAAPPSPAMEGTGVFEGDTEQSNVEPIGPPTPAPENPVGQLGGPCAAIDRCAPKYPTRARVDRGR